MDLLRRIPQVYYQKQRETRDVSDRRRQGGACAGPRCADRRRHQGRGPAGIRQRARDRRRRGQCPRPRPRDGEAGDEALAGGPRHPERHPARADPAPAADARLPLFRKAPGAGVPRHWEESPAGVVRTPDLLPPEPLLGVRPGAEVPWPAYTERLDFELEFGCYIGKPGKDIPKEKAREHIFGYTIFNDFSARDEQTQEMAGQLGPGKGKDFDNANAMGPCLVTADEIGDPYRLEMVVRVNGEEWGRGNSRDMHWKFEDCIAHAARSETLHPGRILRLRHRRQWLRSRADAFPESGRHRRARSRRHRHPAQQGRQVKVGDRHRRRQARQHRPRGGAAPAQGRHAGRGRGPVRGRLRRDAAVHVHPLRRCRSGLGGSDDSADDPIAWQNRRAGQLRRRKLGHHAQGPARVAAARLPRPDQLLARGLAHHRRGQPRRRVLLQPRRRAAPEEAGRGDRQRGIGRCAQGHPARLRRLERTVRGGEGGRHGPHAPARARARRLRACASTASRPA